MRGLDLFSGPGGLTLGLKKAGVEVICAVEKRKDAIDTYSAHTPEADHFCDDIRNVDLSGYRGAVDLVYGGPPCQPFSTGGKRKGTRDNRNMIPAFIETVKLLQPAAMIMENVPGLAVRSRISYLHEVLNSIFEIGYTPSWRVLYSAEYGVPQKRRRLFIVAIRGKQEFLFPTPTHGPGRARDIVPSSAVLSNEPIGEAPNCPVVFAKYPDLRRSPYAGHVYNGQGRPIDMAGPCHTILASAGGYKTHWIDTENIAPKYHEHLSNGGEPWEGEVPGARRMTIEESALIQTFPENMEFAGKRSSQYTQVGDAVPPKLAEQVGEALVAQINDPKNFGEAYNLRSEPIPALML